MQLRPFPVDLAATVAAWATSPKEAAMWCGHTDGPVPAEKVAGWAVGDDVQTFGLYDGDDLVAYGELWSDKEEAESELARLIVDPRRRGQGVGQRLVAELTARSTYPSVLLRVHPDNHAALRCYAAARFTRVSPEQEAEWNAPQPVPYVWLVHTR
ncbi:GNAT family N-acetyltransferase [Plantactinospora sp. B24E8]|uniref:GNAT family N-acetyltransferase n=1 Tax=Plantactinospora sp. B24E8 TaxID=3153567 RepID=UPI00325F47B9